MIKIGLTGNRYAGKNKVCKAFEEISIPVFDADVVLRFIVNHELSVNNLIRKKLSDSYRVQSTYIDIPNFVKSKEDVDIVLNCAEFELFNAYERFCEKNKSSVYSIFKSSILFEKKWNQRFKFNINVFAPKMIRIERYQNIEYKKTSDVSFILRNEIDDLEKNNMADFVVHSYKEIDINKQILNIDQSIIDEYLKNKNLVNEN